MNPIPTIRKKNLAIIYSPSFENGYHDGKHEAETPFNVKHFLWYSTITDRFVQPGLPHGQFLGSCLAFLSSSMRHFRIKFNSASERNVKQGFIRGLRQ